MTGSCVESQADVNYNIRSQPCLGTAGADAAQLAACRQARQGEQVQDWWDAVPATHLVVSAGGGWMVQILCLVPSGMVASRAVSHLPVRVWGSFWPSFSKAPTICIARGQSDSSACVWSPHFWQGRLIAELLGA